jgi:hypothetical protein
MTIDPSMLLRRAGVLAALASFSGVPYPTHLVFDLVATSEGISHYLAVSPKVAETVLGNLRAAIPSLRLDKAEAPTRHYRQPGAGAPAPAVHRLPPKRSRAGPAGGLPACAVAGAQRAARGRLGGQPGPATGGALAAVPSCTVRPSHWAIEPVLMTISHKYPSGVHGKM